MKPKSLAHPLSGLFLLYPMVFGLPHSPIPDPLLPAIDFPRAVSERRPLRPCHAWCSQDAKMCWMCDPKPWDPDSPPSTKTIDTRETHLEVFSPRDPPETRQYAPPPPPPLPSLRPPGERLTHEQLQDKLLVIEGRLKVKYKESRDILSKQQSLQLSALLENLGVPNGEMIPLFPRPFRNWTSSHN